MPVLSRRRSGCIYALVLALLLWCSILYSSNNQMIVEVERGINNEISHLRAGMPVAGIPNFVMEKKDPKVANGKEEFADYAEINGETEFEKEYDKSEKEEEITEFKEDDDLVENKKESKMPERVRFIKTKVEEDNVDEPYNIEGYKIPENHNTTIFDNVFKSEKYLTEGREYNYCKLKELYV